MKALWFGIKMDGYSLVILVGLLIANDLLLYVMSGIPGMDGLCMLELDMFVWLFMSYLGIVMTFLVASNVKEHMDKFHDSSPSISNLLGSALCV